MHFINYWLERDNVHILKASSYFAFLFGSKNITRVVLFKSIRGMGDALFLRVLYNLKIFNMTPTPTSIITRMR